MFLFPASAANVDMLLGMMAFIKDNKMEDTLKFGRA